MARSKKVGGIIGASGLYDIGSAKYGAELEMGVRWGNTFFTVGVGYTPDVWAIAIPNPRDMVVKAGIKHQF